MTNMLIYHFPHYWMILPLWRSTRRWLRLTLMISCPLNLNFICGSLELDPPNNNQPYDTYDNNDADLHMVTTDQSFLQPPPACVIIPLPSISLSIPSVDAESHIVSSSNLMVSSTSNHLLGSIEDFLRLLDHDIDSSHDHGFDVVDLTAEWATTRRFSLIDSDFVDEECFFDFKKVVETLIAANKFSVADVISMEMHLGTIQFVLPTVLKAKRDIETGKLAKDIHEKVKIEWEAINQTLVITQRKVSDLEKALVEAKQEVDKATLAAKEFVIKYQGKDLKLKLKAAKDYEHSVTMKHMRIN